jgi:hypothetical protein
MFLKKKDICMKKVLQVIIISGLLATIIPTQLISMHYPMATQALVSQLIDTKTPKRTIYTRIKKSLTKFAHKRSTKITAAAIITVASIASLATYVYTHPEEASAAIAAYTFNTGDAEIASIHAEIL